MSKRSKRHHIVPQTLQRQFLNQNGKIWFSEKNSQGHFSQPEQRITESAFWKRDHYTTLENGILTDTVEKDFYGAADDTLGQLIPQLVHSIGTGSIPQLDAETIDFVRQLVLIMLKRTPDFLAGNSNHPSKTDGEIGREFVEKILLEGQDVISKTELQKYQENLTNPVKLKQIGRDIRVRSTTLSSPLMESLLKEFSIKWSVSRTHHSFLLSSLIVYRIGNGQSNGLSNPHAELWMPISPKIAIVLIRDPRKKIPHLVEISANRIRAMNEHAISNSKQIGSHSKKLIESLTRRTAIEKS